MLSPRVEELMEAVQRKELEKVASLVRELTGGSVLLAHEIALILLEGADQDEETGFSLQL